MADGNPFETAVTPAAPVIPVAPVTPVPVTPVAPVPEVKPAPVAVVPAVKPEEEETFLGGEEKTPEEKAAAEKAAADAKAEVLKNETPEEKVAREKAEAEAAQKANIVPEKYEVKAPEGMKVDQAFLDNKLAPVLKEHGVTQAAFQKIIDVYAPHLQDQLKQQVANQQTEAIKGFKEMIKGWGKETSEWLGAKPEEARAPAARAINKLSSDPAGLRAILNDTGIGNHKLVVEMFIKAGKLLGEDSFPKGSPAPGTADTSDEAKAERMFGKK